MVTPDHTIRTKNWPLIVPAPRGRRARDFGRMRRPLRALRRPLPGLFRATQRARGGRKRMLDPLPRVVLVPGLGLFGLGLSAKEARIAADLAEAAIETITDAEAIGRFESISEAEMFDMEYWSLEQAKLGKRPSSRSPARSRRSPAPAARSAPRPRARVRGGRRRGRAARRRRRRDRARRRSAARRGRCDVTDAASGAGGLRPRRGEHSAGSTSWCRMPAPPGRAGSARSTKR